MKHHGRRCLAIQFRGKHHNSAKAVPILHSEQPWVPTKRIWSSSTRATPKIPSRRQSGKPCDRKQPKTTRKIPATNLKHPRQGDTRNSRPLRSNWMLKVLGASELVLSSCRRIWCRVLCQAQVGFTLWSRTRTNTSCLGYHLNVSSADWCSRVD